ncbi:MAG: YceI family protein [Desulfatiglans sp.]|jgi:polyisoprenoid-binding protein YceI|nr:YceI family protein [Thermodesulfobacteriota bacterium]MEE4353907.1 YceI family protein [Desulfatiglans sp.]
MKSLGTFVLIFFLSLVFCLPLTRASSGDTETYAVDPIHSTAFFKVGHYGFGFVTGSFTDISGKIVVDRARHTNSRVEIIIKTESIDTNNSQRDEHLKSKDFFDVAQFSSMQFRSRSIKKSSTNLYEVTGDFTLHGRTKTLTVPVRFIGEGKDHYGAYRVGFEAKFAIQRSEYGMTKYIPAAGDRVEIILVVEGIRQ